jgi:hypothetical protein
MYISLSTVVLNSLILGIPKVAVGVCSMKNDLESVSSLKTVPPMDWYNYFTDD